MYADRYQRAKTNPVSLTAAVGINAVLVAALLFSAPDIAEHFDTPFTGYDVPIEPPPPIPPEPKPEAKTPAPASDPLIVTPIPAVPTIPIDNLVRTVDLPQPPVPLLPPVGPPATGTGTIPVDPPKPAPVLVDAAPDPRAEFQPEYPPSERRSGTEGIVTLRVQVGADGRVKAVEAVRSTNDAFFQATRRQALSRWRFTPATRDGVPYESWRTMTVRFRLDG